MNWYEIDNIDAVDSPSLVIYLDNVKANIDKAIAIAGGTERLRPHVKTHKTPEIIDLHLKKGISDFKSATISEAEICAMQGANSVLLAHQLTASKYQRWVNLIETYPNTHFACVVDNLLTIKDLERVAIANQLNFDLFLDINNGMNRSGILPNELALSLCKYINPSKNLTFGGLHVYDGHILAKDFEERSEIGKQDLESVKKFILKLKSLQIKIPEIVVGGSPSFPVHARNQNVRVSPGTYIFWDKGYSDKFQDLAFLHAALVVTRVISKLDEQTVCIDLGHKSIASENPHPRVYFLNCKVEKFLIHSEEHLVIQTPDAKNLKVGDVLYGIPHHICPTVNLNEFLTVIENKKATKTWEVLARKRKITV
jgi:D-serine deaminase-like pyridoxal phosphate-dependent protein